MPESVNAAKSAPAGKQEGRNKVQRGNQMSPKECLTCAFNENPPEELGGRVFETNYWRVEHCVGPVPAG